MGCKELICVQMCSYMRLDVSWQRWSVLIPLSDCKQVFISQLVYLLLSIVEMRTIVHPDPVVTLVSAHVCISARRRLFKKKPGYEASVRV